MRNEEFEFRISNLEFSTRPPWEDPQITHMAQI